MKSILSLTFRILICCTLTLGCRQNPSENSNFQNDRPQPDDSVAVSDLAAAPTTSTNPDINIKYEIKYYDTQIDAATAAAQLAQLGSKNLKQTTIVSSESLNFITDLYKNRNFREIKSDSIFVLYNNSVGRFAKSAATYIKKSYKEDKIGFVVATYTTAIETVMWIHVAPLSLIEKSANIAYTIGLALYFKLNKDKWTEHTQSIKKPFEYFFKSTRNDSPSKQIKYDFLANLALASAISLVRIPLMSMNQIIDSGITFGLFKMPLLLSIAGTAAFFTWSEHQGQIDKNAQPVSKFVFRRISELRSMLVATFASAAALLNPAVFGVTPWVTLAVVGAAGLGLYLKGDQINNWVEKNLKFKKLAAIIRYNSSIFRCESLFSAN